MSDAGPTEPKGELKTRVSISRGFCTWMQQQGTSLLFTSYQTGQICCVGTLKNAEMTFQQAGYARALGLWADGQSVWLGVQSVLWRLENALVRNERVGHYDRMYEPRFTYITGDLDVHELGVASGNRLVFVNTRYSCLAMPSATHNFRPLWKPDFISALAPEDRCHLTGLAIHDGEPRYVTALAPSDEREGWRRRLDCGVLIDVGKNTILCDGLWLPNSPRVHGGKVWLHESGRGNIVTVDPQTGAKEDFAFCPGFLRGLAFHRHFAVATVSVPRADVAGLPLETALAERGAQRRCGVFVFDTRTGAAIEWLTIQGQVTELFDIAVLPGVMAPMADGPGVPGLGSHQVFEPL